MADLENEIDREDAVEYGKLRAEISTQTQAELDAGKDTLVQTLQRDGERLGDRTDWQ